MPRIRVQASYMIRMYKNFLLDVPDTFNFETEKYNLADKIEEVFGDNGFQRDCETCLPEEEETQLILIEDGKTSGPSDAFLTVDRELISAKG